MHKQAIQTERMIIRLMIEDDMEELKEWMGDPSF